MHTDRDSYSAMRAAVQAFHDKHDFRRNVGEDQIHRVALMVEELGEVAACISKGKSRDELAEELADLLILLIGTDIAADVDLGEAFRKRMEALMQRKAGKVDGRIRVSEFRGQVD